MNALLLDFTTVALLSALFGAVGQILARRILSVSRSKDVFALNFLVMAVILLLLSPLFYFFELSFASLGLLLAVVAIDGIGNFYFFKTFEKTEASVASPMLSLAPAFSFIFAIPLLGELPNPFQLLIALAIIVLIVVFSQSSAQHNDFKAHTMTPALIASIMFGLSAILSKILLSQMAVINAPTLYMIRAALLGVFGLFLLKGEMHRLSIREHILIVLWSGFVIAQWLFFYSALSANGAVGVVVTLANVTPIFVFILGVLFLKEKATFKKMLAAILVVILSLHI